MAHEGSRRPRVVARAALAAIVLTVFAATLAACGSSQPTGTVSTPTPTNAPTATATPTATPSVTGYPIKVFFSKTPDSENNYRAVFPVNRVSPTAQVETFSIQLLIAGPTTDETAAGYYTELNRLFTSGTQCPSPSPAGYGGPDFTLTLNHKGTTSEQGTATLKFCRGTMSPGIGTDARVLSDVDATLLQFSTIKKVVVLTVNGHCFGDESGQDQCLK